MDSYFPHDDNASNNIKIMKLIEKENMKGLGVYWTLIEFLRQQKNYVGSMEILGMLARKMKVSMKTTERIIKDYKLFNVDGTTFSSPGLIRRMAPLDAKREAKKESGRCGGLVNQQKIRDSKASTALANNKSNEINNSPSISPQGESVKKEEIILVPPAYALNPNTHNFQGLIEELQRHKITDITDINILLRLSDFGRLGGKIWKLLYDLNTTRLNSKIVMPGKYIIKILRSE